MVSTRCVVVEGDEDLVPTLGGALGDAHGEVVEELVRQDEARERDAREIVEARRDRAHAGDMLVRLVAIGSGDDGAERLVGGLERDAIALRVT